MSETRLSSPLVRTSDGATGFLADAQQSPMAALPHDVTLHLIRTSALSSSCRLPRLKQASQPSRCASQVTGADFAQLTHIIFEHAPMQFGPAQLTSTHAFL